MEFSEDTVNAVRALIEAKKAELLEAEKVRDELAHQAAAVQADVDALTLGLARLSGSAVDGEIGATTGTSRRGTLH